jgi:hypothetical protein
MPAAPLPQSLVALCVLVAVCGVPPLAHAQHKNVVFEPTPHETVTRMLNLARVGASDMLIDLGSGDGRIAIAAAMRGARALGIEIDAELVEKARAAAAAAGVASRASFRREDLFQTPLDQAAVVTLYLLPELNVRLRPRLLALRPGVRVVSHQFPMGDWRPDVTDDNGGRIHLWIVPAKVEGRWQLRHGEDHITLDFKQRYQDISGSASGSAGALPLADARLRSNEIEFTLDVRGRPIRFRGTVAGNAMQGSGGGLGFGNSAREWKASRL